MTERLFLGFDLGTTNTKVASVGEDGLVSRRASRPMHWIEQRPGWGECSAEVIVSAVESLIKEVVDAETRERGPIDIAGIGFASFAESGVLVDEKDTQVAPMIAWFDPRGQDAASKLERGLADAFPKTTGLPVAPLASIFKLAWMRDHGIVLPGHQWLSISEYVCRRLGSRRASELSLLGRTGLLDLRTLRPWDSALEFLGVDQKFLPDLVGAGQPLGRVRSDFAVTEARGAVLCVAGHDHAVAAAASGAAQSGAVLDSMGTAEALVAATETLPSPDSMAELINHGLTVYPHVVANTICLIAGHRTGLVLKHVLRMIDKESADDRLELDQAALKLSDGAGPTIEILGLNMDDEDVDVTVSSDEFAPVDIWAAAVAQSRDAVAAKLVMMQAHGIDIHELVLAGGWSNMASIRKSREGIVAATRIASLPQPGTWGAARFALWALDREETGGGDPMERPPATFFRTSPPRR